MPTSNMPGSGAMNDSLEFVKNLWGNMGVPGLAAPTLSVDDLDKKIKDLRAVEVWLNMNTSMLRTTIQTLEVQRATLATLKSMGESMAGQGTPNPFAAFAQQAAGPAAGAVAPDPSADAAEKPSVPPQEAAQAMGMANPAVWWNMMQEQFAQAVAQAAAASAAASVPSDESAAPPQKPAGGKPPAKPHSRRRSE